MSESDEIYYDLIDLESGRKTAEMIRISEDLKYQINSQKVEPNKNIQDSIVNFKIDMQTNIDNIFINMIHFKENSENINSTIKKKSSSNETEYQQNIILTFGKNKTNLSPNDKNYLSPQKLEKRLKEYSNNSPSKSMISSESTINFLSSTRSNEDNTIVNLINNNIFKLERNDFSSANESFLNIFDDNKSESKKIGSNFKSSPKATTDISKYNMPADKLVFIKNQMKNEIASFNSYGK